MGESSTTSDMQMIPLMAKREELKSLLMRVKEESERASLTPNIKKSKIRAFAPLLHGKQKGKRWK